MKSSIEPLPILPIEHLILHPSEEPIASRIIGRASFLRHGSCESCIVHDVYPLKPSVVESPIRMDDGFLRTFQQGNAITQHAVCKLRIWNCTDAPWDHHPIIAGNERIEINLAGRDTEFRDVGNMLLHDALACEYSD